MSVLGVMLVPGASAHGDVDSGMIAPGQAYTWAADQPVALSYKVDGVREGAVRVLYPPGDRPVNHTVRITGDGAVRLEPQDLTVRFLDNVTWVNEDDASHRITGTPGSYRPPARQPSDRGAPAQVAMGALGVVAVAAWRRRAA